MNKTRLLVMIVGFVLVAIVLVVTIGQCEGWFAPTTPTPTPPPGGAIESLPSPTVTAVSAFVEQAWDYVFRMGEIVGEVRAEPLAALFPDTHFYVMQMPSPSIEWQWGGVMTVAVREGTVYFMPRDFNRLLVDAGVSAEGREQEAVLQALVLLRVHYETDALPIRFEDYNQIDERQGHTVHYTAEITSWSEGEGVRIHWKFDFWNGQIDQGRGEVIAVGDGAPAMPDYGLLYKVGDTVWIRSDTVWEGLP